MANQIKTKFIGNDQVTSEKVLLENNSALRAKDSSNVTQEIIKLDGTDKLIAYRSTGAEEIAYLSDVNSGGTALQDHIDDASGAHAASAISVTPNGNLAASDVQAALQELQGDIDGLDSTYVNVGGDTMTGDLTLTNASVKVTDASSNVILDAGPVEFNYKDSSGNSRIYASTVSAFTAFQTIDGTKAAGVSAIIAGASIKSELISIDSSNSFEAKVQNDFDVGGEPFSKTRVTGTAGTSSVTVEPAKASLAIGSATYDFSPTTLDMDGKKIVDVQQLENLSPGTALGNVVRFDELGAYSVSAGYGIPTLDTSGKIPSQFLPNAIMEYKGTWNAATNTPTLANGSPANAPEDAGHLYIVSVGGTVNFGAGPISFNAGDSVILNASLVWEKSTTANLVTSVNGAQGVVVLTASSLTYQQGNASDWTVADNTSIKLALDEAGSRLTLAESDINAVENDVSNLVTLSGVAVDSTTLGVFTGVTIPDSQTVKQALQSLETAHEEHLNDSSDAHMASAIGLSPAINSQTTVQGSLGDHETRIDAIEAMQWAAPYKKTLVAGDITNGFIDLPHLAINTNAMDAFVDRLAIHQGVLEDYSLSVVGGVTRMTFLNDLINPGAQKLAVGDTIYVRYMRNI